MHIKGKIYMKITLRLKGRTSHACQSVFENFSVKISKFEEKQKINSFRHNACSPRTIKEVHS